MPSRLSPLPRPGQVQSSSSVKLLISEAGNLVPMTMACDTPPFNDPRSPAGFFRLMADRPALLESAQDGYGSLGNNLFGKGFALYDTRSRSGFRISTRRNSFSKRPDTTG